MLSRKKLLIAAMLGFVCGAALVVVKGVDILHVYAQSTRNVPVNYSNVWQLTPVDMPAVLTNLCSLPGGPPCGRYVVVCQLDLTGHSGTTTQFTIQDFQSPGIYFFHAT